MQIKYWRNRPSVARKEYGVYHHGEGSPDHIQHVENNAPSMSERLWRIREQLTIAEKIIFDAIIELPEMEKREAVRKVSEYTGTCKETVRWTFGTIMWTIKNMDELDNIREAA
tara:strand:+ start:1307 stop:1645 length:339 start_codon:yes stop_codon:yes gene_type:complete